MAKRRGAGRGAKANAGRSYRLHPSDEVAERLRRWGHTRRFIWNALLADRRLAESLHLQADPSSVLVDELRAQHDWVEDLPRQAANEVIRALDAAYASWLDPENPAQRPSFEKRRSGIRFSLPGQATEVRHLDRKWSEVWVPKLGWVRFRRHRPLDGEVRNLTLRFSPVSGWSVSFGVACKEMRAPSNGLPPVGVDFGVACSAYCSDESEPRLMPPTLTDGEKRRLIGLERQKARQLAYAKKHNNGRYSKRLRRTINEIAALKALEARRRNDFTHKLTTDLAKSHGIVGIEDLRVKSMTASASGTVEDPGTNVAQKAGLNRAILDNAPGERRRQLEYKCPKFGSVIVPVPAPGTSNTCPNPTCGKSDPANRVGCGRVFACVWCGYQGHADKVASMNIEARAVKKFAACAAGPAVNSTGRRKPSRRKAGGSVKRVVPALTRAGRDESRVA